MPPVLYPEHHHHAPDIVTSLIAAHYHSGIIMDESVPNGLLPETFAARLHAAVIAGDSAAVATLLKKSPQTSGMTGVDAPDIDTVSAFLYFTLFYTTGNV